MSVTEGVTRSARAADDLYRAHAGEVYRYAYAMLGNRSDAEDVTQTTFVNALRALERGDRPRKPSAWLVTIAHNIVRQRFRQQQARPTEVELAEDVALEEPQEQSPSVEELVKALQRIPHTQREAIVMRELEGRSYKEIEAIMELTPGALETLLFRARRSLAEELENLVTCERAELAMSKQLDSRLSRKERRRLEEHLRDCPSCARLNTGRTKHRRAFRALSVLPLPFTLHFFRDAPTASAASGLSTIGAGSAAATGVGVTCGSVCATGGLFAGGLAVKTAAVVAVASMAGSIGYEGVKHKQKPREAAAPIAAAAQPDAGAGEAAVLPGQARIATARIAASRKRATAAAAAATAAAATGRKAHARAAEPHYTLAVSAPRPQVSTAAAAEPKLVWTIQPGDAGQSAATTDASTATASPAPAAPAAASPAPTAPAGPAMGTVAVVVTLPQEPAPAATPAPTDTTTVTNPVETTPPPAGTTPAPPADTTPPPANTTPPPAETTPPPTDTTPPPADTANPPTTPADPAPASVPDPAAPEPGTSSSSAPLA